MKDKKSEIQQLLEKGFPGYTPQAIIIMIKGYEKIREELIKRLKTKRVNQEVIRDIEDFK